jgi:aryl-alcohol dehydrogenase-like predicted oxidoreductase
MLDSPRDRWNTRGVRWKNRFSSHVALRTDPPDMGGDLMRSRPFRALGSVSALSLGGGGIGRVYGSVDSDEALATVRDAIEAGIDLLDVAPTYGPGEASPEAEIMIARAFDGRIPDHVRISSKVLIEDPAPPRLIRETIRDSVQATLRRIGRDHLDLLILHSYIRPSDSAPVEATASVDTVREVIRPEFERLVSEGSISGWGLTASAAPDPLCELLADEPGPAAIQCVTNALDSIGELWPPGLAGTPDNARIRQTAGRHGVSVMGIRALAAGGLSGKLDRDPQPGHPAARDARRAQAFLQFAHEAGTPPAVLAHRYAASLPDVTTLVIGAKTRSELAEALAAERAKPLSREELAEIETAARTLVHA